MNTSIFYILCLLLPSFAFGSVCGPYKESPTALKVKKDFETRVDQFAGNKVIAAQADATLSKLLTAKSPLITSWMSKRSLNEKSETEIVLAWRHYFAHNFILTKYPQDEAKVNAETEALVNGLLKTHLTPKFKKHLESLFEKSQTLALKTIQEFHLEQAPAIVERVKTIKLYWPEDLKTARNNSIPLDIVEWGIAYDPVANEINIGLQALAYPDNDDTYIAVLAHEIGHSFDSCRWGAFFDGKWPFEKVGECLRSDTSVAAKKRDDSSLEGFFKAGKISADLVAALKANPTCNKQTYPPMELQADQLPESFADWFSAEVMARLPKLRPERMRIDLCQEKTLIEGTSYPTNLARLEKIYLKQPKIKAHLKNTSVAGGVYCSLK